MEKTKINTKEYFVIDLSHIIKTLLHRAWLIVLTSFIGAAIGFSVAAFAKAVHIRRELAQTVVHILHYLEVIEQVGKQGRAYLYKVKE